MNRKMLISVVSALILLPTLAFAKGRHDGGGGIESMYFHKVHFYLQHKNEIGLADDQVEKIKAIKFDVKRAMVDTNAQTELAMIDFEQELHKDAADLKKLEAAINQKMAAKTAIYKTAAKAILDTKTVLSTDQRAKAKELYWEKKYSAKSHHRS